MATRFSRRVVTSVLSLLLVVVPALGQTQQKPLEAKDDPLLIGKRDINKGTIDFYSLDREVAICRQLAAEVDRSSRQSNDPLIAEYVNRVA